jgi:CubicO group peptidase (beta-lactamase class C family)
VFLFAPTSFPVKQIFAMHPLCLLAVLFGLAAPHAESQNLPKPAAKARDLQNTIRLPAEETIKSWMAEHKVPLVGIGIIEGGKIKQVKLLGELDNGTPAPANTFFNVASITKPVVAVLTLTLVSRGQWALDEPLAAWWVDPDVAGDPRHQKLTTRHVLSHQTGFPNWRWQDSTKKLAFAFEPGTGVKYSGEGLEYLRRALERKFKKSLDQLSDSLLFKPLGMKNTRYYWGETTDEALYAGKHDEQGKAYEMEKWSEPNAANLILTTVEDYCKFGVAVMKGVGLSKPVFAQMVTPQSKLSSGQNLAFGLGWLLVKDLSNGEYVLLHSGHNPGLHTVVMLLPESGRGIVVLTNGHNGDKVYEKIIAGSLDVGKELLERME